MVLKLQRNSFIASIRRFESRWLHAVSRNCSIPAFRVICYQRGVALKRREATVRKSEGFNRQKFIGNTIPRGCVSNHGLYINAAELFKASREARDDRAAKR